MKSLIVARKIDPAISELHSHIHMAGQLNDEYKYFLFAIAIKMSIY